MTDGNYLSFAIKHYSNPQCKSVDEFQDDLNRIKYIKRLFRKYLSSGDLRERLILNHLIIFSNVFGVEAAGKILFFKMDIDLYPILKTFLVYLDYFPEPASPDMVAISLVPDVISILRQV